MILERLRAMLGPSGVVETDQLGITRVAPQSDHECALVLRTAAREQWRVRIEGTGGWTATDAPADLAVTTRGLNRILHLDSTDLVATVESGVLLDDLRAALADKGMWLAIDAPGVGRSVGSVIATGTSGPLRTGYGAIRDHILGMTLVTGDGRRLEAGGKVMKNVAGFDLPKLAAGSFGAFGIITSVHLRVRAVPRADVSFSATGSRDTLLKTAREILDAGTTPAALVIASPAVAETDEWLLALRLIGSEVSVESDHEAVAAAVGSGRAPVTLHKFGVEEGASFWRSALASAIDAPTTLRVGTVPTALEEALDTVAHHLDDAWLMVHVRSGVVRWSGDAPSPRLRLLRHAAAQREMPVTVERGTWATRHAVGHFGAYREGTGRLVDSLRETFDPSNVLVVPLDAEDVA